MRTAWCYLRPGRITTSTSSFPSTWTRQGILSLISVLLLVLSVFETEKYLNVKRVTSWNNSNKVLVIQCRSRVVTDFKNLQKDWLMHNNYYPLVKLAPKSIGQLFSTLFKLQDISSYRRTSKESFWPIKSRSENVKITFLLNKIIFEFFLTIF